MDELQSRFDAIMNDPKMMEQIMSMAQSLNTQDPAAEVFGNVDLSMLQQLSSFASQSHIDSQQQNLLQALAPYLNRQRISRLERAMRAAKMAGFATTLLPQLAQGR